MMTHTGTEGFSAPEMFNGIVYDNAVDIWSSGCVLYTMLAGYMPFFEENSARLQHLIKNGKYDMTQDPWPQISSDA